MKFDTWFCGSFGRPDGEQHAEPDSAPEQGGQCADREAVQAVLCGNQLSQHEVLFASHRHHHTPQAIHGTRYKDLWMDVDTEAFSGTSLRPLHSGPPHFLTTNHNEFLDFVKSIFRGAAQPDNNKSTRKRAVWCRDRAERCQNGTKIGRGCAGTLPCHTADPPFLVLYINIIVYLIYRCYQSITKV